MNMRVTIGTGGRLSGGRRIALLLGVIIHIRRLYLTALVALVFAGPALGAGTKSPGKMPDKVDKALAGELKRGASTHKVIITFKPGYRTAGKKALLQRKGNKIKREHASLDML